MSPLRTVAVYIGALGIVAFALIFLFRTTDPSFSTLHTESPNEVQTASLSAASATTSFENKQEKSPVRSSSNSNKTRTRLASRIQNPYSFPALSFDTIHKQTRAALVNIFCASESGPIRPISGSGVIIDSRGVILTNAHVAQYLLLAESGRTNLACSIRWGSPAQVTWNAEVLYLPPIWIHTHASDITNAHPTGTGEHDYALLRITGAVDPLASDQMVLPSIPTDIREGIGFPGDMTLTASYPAEFVGAAGTVFGLHPISSTAPIEELFTFGNEAVDLISLGGVIGAQGGSSGGPVVNAWGHVIGIITTTSEGATTAERKLRALTLSYINRDLKTQSGLSLEGILSGDIASRSAEFNTQYSPSLVQLLIDQVAN